VGTTPNGVNTEGFLAGVNLTGTAMSLLSTPGTLDPLHGLQFDGGSGYVLAVTPAPTATPYLGKITTLSPTVVANVEQALGSGLPLGLAASGQIAWWIHSATNPLCYSDSFSTFVCTSIPATAPVAIASASWLLPPQVYVADTTGVIRSYAAPLTSGAPGTQVVAAAGKVGAMAARQNGVAATELYWTELDTGDVRLWSTTDPAVRTIFRGAGPASRMHIAASSGIAIYWTNATTGDVMMHVPGTGATRIGRSPSPQLIAIDDLAWVYWSDADGTIRSTPW
jgi:hypothetical protein